jgi:hypothetical protein
MANLEMKGAPRQQLLGLAHLSWQPGNVDFAAFPLVNLQAKGA